MAMVSFRQRVLALQAELKAPKGQFNNFGKYNYRSCEDILEAAKPLCEKNNVILTLSDSIEVVKERVYVKATAALTSTDSDESISTTAYAREPETKKGMDDSQITGTASSYARKYALNGLLCIDDSKDADTNEYSGQQNKVPDGKSGSDKAYICSVCKCQIRTAKGKNGTILSPETVYNSCGGKCLKCYQEEQKAAAANGS